MFASWAESNDKPTQCIEKQRHYSANKGPYSQGYGLPCGHVELWELDRKEGRTPKNWCLWTVVPEKTPQSALDCKEIKPVHPKGNQSWLFIGRTEAEAEVPVFWSSDANRRLTEKVSDAGKGWGQKDNRVQRMRWLDGITDAMAINMNLGELWEMVRDREAWHAAVHGGCKKSGMTGRLNSNNNHLPNSKIFTILSHLIPTTIFQGGYYYFAIQGIRSGGSEKLNNTYKFTQPTRDSVGMGLTNSTKVLSNGVIKGQFGWN